MGPVLLGVACLASAILAVALGLLARLLFSMRTRQTDRYVDEEGREIVAYLLTSSVLVSPLSGRAWSLRYSPWLVACCAAGSMAFLILALALGASLFEGA